MQRVGRSLATRPIREVGRVAGLWRYPVKSMAAEALDEADVSWHGLAGDRRWAFIRNGSVHSGFPWLTIRQQPRMVLYRPRFVEPDHPNASPTMVRTPSGPDLDVADPTLAAELGDGVRVIKQDRGIFDSLPLSLITTQSVASLAALVGAQLDVQRFRPNLLIEAADGEAFPEDRWIGSVLHISGTQVRVDASDRRCVVVDVDPVTTQRNQAALHAITRQRQGRLGVYGSIAQPGRIAIGDPVLIGEPSAS